tara:strand:- start:5839 stop:7728 length:1890 start_codon:yes stop_codon:yes gene_type:complete
VLSSREFARLEQKIMYAVILIVILSSSVFSYVYLNKSLENRLINANRVVELTFLSILENCLEDINDFGQEVDFEKLRKFALKRERYSQVRVLNAKGLEVFRMNRKSGSVEEVLGESLQNKSHRYYIQAAQDLDVGEVYISPLDYNVEKGVTYKDQITFRIAKKLLDGSILVLNIDSLYILNRVSLTERYFFSLEKKVRHIENRLLPDYLSKITFDFNKIGNEKFVVEPWSLFIGFNPKQEYKEFLFVLVLISFFSALVIFLLNLLSKRILSNRRFYAALENLALESAAFTLTDEKGTIKAVNHKFQDISGYSKKETLGKTFNLINSGIHEKEFWENMWDTIASGQIWTGTIQNKAKDGHSFWLETIIAPIKKNDDEIEGFFSFGIDITKSVKLEEKLGALRVQNVASINKMSSHLAHEYGTPLGIIQSSKEILEELVFSKLPKDQKLTKHFNNIQYGLDQINSINNMIRFLGRKSIDLPDISNQCSLLRVIEDSTFLLAKDIEHYGIDLKFVKDQLDIKVKGHYTLLVQVFVNLLNNSIFALKKNQNKKIVIEINEFKDHIELFISDNGEGIPEEISENIFDSFFTSKKLNEGSGLGLSFCREVLEFYGGSIDYVPSLEGAKFKVTYLK